MKTSTTGAALAGGMLAALLLIAGCDGGNEGPAEQAGEQVDEAAEQAAETVEEATEATGEAVEEAGDEAEEATE